MMRLFSEYTKIIELYTLNGCIVWYMSYILINSVLRKKRSTSASVFEDISILSASVLRPRTGIGYSFVDVSGVGGGNGMTSGNLMPLMHRPEKNIYTVLLWWQIGQFTLLVHSVIQMMPYNLNITGFPWPRMMRNWIPSHGSRRSNPNHKIISTKRLIHPRGKLVGPWESRITAECRQEGNLVSFLSPLCRKAINGPLFIFLNAQCQDT